MENNKIQEIYNRLTTDQAFADELKKFAEGKQISSLEEDAAAFVEFAKLQGYDITIDELKAFVETQCQALNEEELDSVAAGICGMIGCGFHEDYSAGKIKCIVIGGRDGITGANSK